MHGIVTSFDDARGLGALDADGEHYPFHCTALVDGTRTIEVGTSVTFGLRPGGLGRWEATAIERLEPDPR
ncbi:MAG: hypothetical protein ABIY48_02720 [Acidimicrobiales bacterium]